MAISRRNALKALGAVPAAVGFTWTPADAEHAHQAATQARKATTAARSTFKPKFFMPPEWATVRVLVDLIIPKDERSGSATDAAVPEFMDFVMLAPAVTGEADRARRQTAMRGGLRWLDAECRRRFDKTFVGCTAAERTEVLDAIAWPDRAKDNPAISQGLAFFSSFRDLTASGFWSSKMGIDDLKYMGNVAYPNWDGCPPEALSHLGLTTDN
jgi:gluconate 2-dehydrogenase gamma chain